MSETLPELPEGWVWTTVGEVASLVQYGTSAKASSDANGVPVLRMGNVDEGRLVRLDDLKYLPLDHQEFPNLLLQDGDVLFNRTNSAELVGKAAVYRDQLEVASFASYLIRVRLSDEVLPEWLVAYLTSPFGRQWVASAASQQVGQANVNGTKLRSLRFPLPPLEEQRAICDRLEDVSSVLDQAASELEEAAALSADYRLALTHQALLRRDEAEFVPLGDLVEILDRFRVPVNRDERAARVGDVPYYGAAGQVGWIDEPLFDEELVLLGEDGIQFHDPYATKAYVIDGPSWVNNHAHVLRPRKDRIRTRLLLHALNAADYSLLANGTTRLKLTKSSMLQIRVWAPPLEVQDAVLAELDEALGAANETADAIREVSRERQGLRASVLRRAFTGDLHLSRGPSVELGHEVGAVS